MTILFVGGDPECFNYIGSVTFNTTVGSPARFQNTHQRGAHVANHESYTQVPNFGAQDEIWLRYYHAASANNHDGNQGIVRFFNNAGSERFRLERDGGGGGNTMQARYWNGSGFTDIGAASATYYNFFGYVDVHLIVNDVSGSFEVYQNGSLVDSGTADFSSISDIAYIQFGRGAGTGNASTQLNVSEVIVSTEPTIGLQLFTREPTSNGSETDWSGSYADVDEAINNDADFLSSSVDGDISTFFGAGMSTHLSGSGLAVRAVVISARARDSGAVPDNIEGVVKIGGTNYDSAPKTLDTAFTTKQLMFETDPSTSAPWAPEDVEASTFEFGVKAST